MEAKVSYLSADYPQSELQHFILEGLQDLSNNNLLDFDTTFDELEERFGAND